MEGLINLENAVGEKEDSGVHEACGRLSVGLESREDVTSIECLREMVEVFGINE